MGIVTELRTRARPRASSGSPVVRQVTAQSEDIGLLRDFREERSEWYGVVRPSEMQVRCGGDSNLPLLLGHGAQSTAPWPRER